MQALRSWLGLMGTLALASLPAPAGAQPVGSEFQVNTYTTSNQFTRSDNVASDASGKFVVVWEDQGRGDSFGRRFDSAGGALGAEFRVNSYTTSSQSSPSVASGASGNFVVVWSSFGQDGWYDGIFGKRYDSLGGALGSEFRVNSFTRYGQGSPSVASDASGNFVVVWQSYNQDGHYYGVFGQRYDSAGVTLGAEFRVNSYTPEDQSAPSVASDASGNFVVVWQSYDQDGNEDWGIFGQRYDSEGVLQGGEFRVNSYTTDRQQSPSVASDASGNFVVVWHSRDGQDGSGYGVFGQRYDSEGVPQGGEFQVNTYTTGNQTSPSVASDASGNFVVLWTARPGRSDGYGVFGQRYDSGGVARGDEFRVNAYTTNWQFGPSADATGTDKFVVAWTSKTQDGSGDGVFGRRYNFAGATITVVRPNTNVRWRIGSVKEIGWTHNLGLNSTFRIELDRDDDGNYEELIAADAPAESPTSGSFVWSVSGPPSATARVRVSWTDDLAVSDTSDVTFRIAPPG